MKKLSLIMCMCVLTIFAAGCNNNDDAQKNNQANDNQTTENNNGNDTATDNNNTNNQATDNNADTNTNKNDSAYSFRDFDLEVKYENNKDYEVSYENDNDGIEASIEDDRNNERVNGNDAVDRLDPIFKKLDIDSNTSQDDVISRVISAFELDDNYQAVDIDISFNDGTEKEYRNNK